MLTKTTKDKIKADTLEEVDLGKQVMLHIVLPLAVKIGIMALLATAARRHLIREGKMTPDGQIIGPVGTHQEMNAR